MNLFYQKKPGFQLKFFKLLIVMVEIKATRPAKSARVEVFTFHS